MLRKQIPCLINKLNNNSKNKALNEERFELRNLKIYSEHRLLTHKKYPQYKLTHQQQLKIL